MRATSALLLASLAAACAQPADDADPDFPTASCATSEAATCLQFGPDEVDALQEAVNLLTDDTEILLGKGTFSFDNQLTLRSADGILLAGQGKEDTILDFSGLPALPTDGTPTEGIQANGVDFVGKGFTIQDLTIANAKKDGLRVEDSEDVVIRRVKATWTNGPSSDNGAYALYPVKSRRVLMEDCEAWNASDAGLYVGQCQDVVVRNNYASGNVAGLEIENSQYVEVYGNTVEDNTGGLLVFDLPGNPIVGRDIYVHDNTVKDNNRPNFAPSGVVGIIPAGTGTLVLASRRVELARNTYTDNNTTDIVVFSGLAIESDTTKWAIAEGTMVGSVEGAEVVKEGTSVLSYRTNDVWIHDNSHSGGGTNVDNGDTDLEARELGFLVSLLYGDEAVDSVLYDAIGESAYDKTEASGNSNDHHLCLGTITGGSFASLDLETLAGRFEAFDFATTADLFRPPAPYTPFDCAGWRGPARVPPDVDAE